MTVVSKEISIKVSNAIEESWYEYCMSDYGQQENLTHWDWLDKQGMTLLPISHTKYVLIANSEEILVAALLRWA